MSEPALIRYMVIDEGAGAGDTPDDAGVIAVVSWNWGPNAAAGDAGTGAEVYHLSITREVDAASPRFLRLFETGTPIAKASLYEYLTTSTGRKPTAKYDLTHLTVVHYRSAASDPGSSRESFGMLYAELVVRYFPLRSDPGGLN